MNSNVNYNFRGRVKEPCTSVQAFLYTGEPEAVRAIEIFAKTKSHDCYAVPWTQHGVTYVRCVLNLPVTGAPNSIRPVGVEPGCVLVKTADGGFFTMPAPSFYEVYDPLNPEE